MSIPSELGGIDMHGEFTWIDLSTFDVPRALDLYGSVFHWRFDEETGGYVNCFASGVPCAGIFEMPERFQKINMPSFWMTYISVEDIASTVATAKELGGRVELEQQNSRGKIALIRDPSGAGFTCYEGPAQSAMSHKAANGRWLGSELFVSDLSKVEDFYEQLFQWTFEPDVNAPDRYLIYSHRTHRNPVHRNPVHRNRGDQLGAVQVASNAVKGEKEFWAAFFAVDDASSAVAKVSEAGGHILYEYSTADGTHYLAQDPQGAAFFMTSSRGQSTPTAGSEASTP